MQRELKTGVIVAAGIALGMGLMLWLLAPSRLDFGLLFDPEFLLIFLFGFGVALFAYFAAERSGTTGFEKE